MHAAFADVFERVRKTPVHSALGIESDLTTLHLCFQEITHPDAGGLPHFHGYHDLVIVFDSDHVYVVGRRPLRSTSAAAGYSTADVRNTGVKE